MLDEKRDIVWWSGDGKFPSGEAIEEITLCLTEGAIRDRDLEDCRVQNRSDTVSEIVKLSELDSADLGSSFCSETHYFSTLLLLSSDSTEANLCVRLQTRGLAGWTQYRIAWRRIGPDDYASNAAAVFEDD